MGYCCYCLRAPNCLFVLYYSAVPSLYLLRGIPLFSQCTSLWFVPFAYVIFAKYTYNLAKFLYSDGTILGWWNDQRIWLYKITTSYLFALVDTLPKSLGFLESTFVISTKVIDEDVSEMYEKEIMEFGASSSMFTILATLALINLFSLTGAILKKVATGDHEAIVRVVDGCCRSFFVLADHS